MKKKAKIKTKNLKQKKSKKLQKSKTAKAKIKAQVKSKAKSSSAKRKKPIKASTMEELLAKTKYELKGLQKGQQIEGTITDITKKTILVDIGAKTEGILVDKEYEAIEDYLKELVPGDKVKVIVVSPENDKGQILLSLSQAAMDYKWSYFEQLLKTGEPVEVRGLESNKGGLIARLMGVRGFIPASQLSSQFLGHPEKLQNKLFQVKIIEVNRDKNRLIFSEKAVSEAKSIKEKKEVLKKIKKDDVLTGKVSGIMPFGIFIQAEKEGVFLDGLVHISEVSWERVENLNSLFKVGQKIKVKVLGVDKNSTKLTLSIKRLKEDPWLKISQKYQPEKKFKGRVTRLAPFGAFVELEEGIEGLIHISKIPADFEVKVGKKVDVYLENLDLEKRRMSLGLVLKEKPVGYK